jgi:hypothetical protein
MRLAKVEAIVKSISGHQTDRMREHYSAVVRPAWPGGAASEHPSVAPDGPHP